MLGIPVRVTEPVKIDTASDSQLEWSVVDEWTRLDYISGLVMQTGLVVLIACITFATQSEHKTLREWCLLVAAAIAFVAVVASIISLGVEAPNDKAKPRPSRILWNSLMLKRWRLNTQSAQETKRAWMRVGLYSHLASVGVGTFFTIASFA
jgi:hypothetical protein